MKMIMIFFCVFALTKANAQLTTPDTIITSQGDIIVQPVFHGALVLQWNGKCIYIDPYNGAGAYKTLHKPDLVLITDIHGDHMDIKTLQALDLSNANLIVPQAVATLLPAEWKEKTVVLSNGNTTEQSGISIHAIPMYNLPDDSTSRHTKGRGNGYVLTLGDKNLYISGDTEDIPEMRSLKNIDVAFICMNIPYTMTEEQAAGAVLDFKPKMVYPYHYRGQGGFSDTQKFKMLVHKDDPLIDVRLKDWYAGGR
ncbi:MBL fold metallo-hydrolase [Agriterribacter sp.]|uniref:MBL fold metallo-hydrolase n=1 Tax=Agriterribacter sp. TaxID=2821509 RepID=UPI002C5B8F8E|nr:MBL fold metallo-hydrolase [Agriterribacter sp.]HRO48087.1 MBL fold metallo-hydrolase [Agriterribacter sp.]HRQ19199.1 MBL fold metallo-hydrolase [Agriterribacter sp.]